MALIFFFVLANLSFNSASILAFSVAVSASISQRFLLYYSFGFSLFILKVVFEYMLMLCDPAFGGGKFSDLQYALTFNRGLLWAIKSDGRVAM